MSHPYTRCVFRGILTAGSSSVLVPAAKTWIVTDADFVVTSTTEGSIYLQDGAGVIFYFVDSAQIARPGAYFAYRGRQAFGPGETLKIVWGLGSWHVRITAYELDA